MNQAILTNLGTLMPNNVGKEHLEGQDTSKTHICGCGKWLTEKNSKPLV